MLKYIMQLKLFLDEMKDRIELMFLPLYNPNLNLLEGLWGWLKSSVINNVFFKNIFEVRKSVQNFIKCVNKFSTESINRLCVKM